MSKCGSSTVPATCMPQRTVIQKKKIKVFLPNFTFTAFYSSIFAKVTVGKNCNRLDTSQGPDISS